MRIKILTLDPDDPYHLIDDGSQPTYEVEFADKIKIDPSMSRAMNGITLSFVMAAAWMAARAAPMSFPSLNDMFGWLWPSGLQTPQYVSIPYGTRWEAGTCSPWRSGAPFASGYGSVSPCYQLRTAETPAGLTDAEINSGLASYAPIQFIGYDYTYQGLNYYTVYGSLARDQSVSDWQRWDSNVNGWRAASAVPMTGALQDDMLEMWKRAGVRPVPLPYDYLAHVGAQPFPSGAGERAWEASPPFVPVWIGAGGEVHVGFPSRGGNGIDVVVPGVVGRPGVRPSDPPIIGVPPGSGTNTGVKPVVVTPGVVTPQGVIARPNAVTQVVARPAVRASHGVHEVKGRVGQAMWAAMHVRGQISEVEDMVDAVYKALPASLRKQLRRKNGKDLSTLDKLSMIFKYYNRVDIPEAIMNMVITQIDDMLAAGMAAGEDELLRQMFPDFETRLVVRQFVRQARAAGGAERQKNVRASDFFQKADESGWFDYSGPEIWAGGPIF